MTHRMEPVSSQNGSTLLQLHRGPLSMHVQSVKTESTSHLKRVGCVRVERQTCETRSGEPVVIGRAFGHKRSGSRYYPFQIFRTAGLLRLVALEASLARRWSLGTGINVCAVFRQRKLITKRSRRPTCAQCHQSCGLHPHDNQCLSTCHPVTQTHNNVIITRITPRPY